MVGLESIVLLPLLSGLELLLFRLAVFRRDCVMNIVAMLLPPFLSIAVRQIVYEFVANPSPTPATVLLSSSPDYWMDGITTLSVIVSAIALFAAFRAVQVNKTMAQRSIEESRKQTQTSIEESRRQAEASLQVSKASVDVALATVKEMRTAREEENAPYVIAHFDLDGPMVYVVVKNLGKSIAKNIKFSVDPPFAVFHPTANLNEISLFKEGIAMLAPGSEIRVFFASTMECFGQSNIPRQYKMTIAYNTSLVSKVQWHEMVLDLSSYYGLPYFNEETFDDLVKEVERIRKAFETLNETNKRILSTIREGFWIKNTEFFVADLNGDAASLAFIESKLYEFGAKWQHSIYKTTVETDTQGNKVARVDPDRDDTRYDCAIFCQQILFALSKCQPTLSEDLYKKIVDVATTLFRMSKLQARHFGEDFSAEFNESGEHVLQIAEEITSLRKKVLPSANRANASI